MTGQKCLFCNVKCIKTKSLIPLTMLHLKKTFFINFDCKNCFNNSYNCNFLSPMKYFF